MHERFCCSLLVQGCRGAMQATVPGPSVDLLLNEIDAVTACHLAAVVTCWHFGLSCVSAPHQANSQLPNSQFRS
jgi:hypothetical protein